MHIKNMQQKWNKTHSKWRCREDIQQLCLNEQFNTYSPEAWLYLPFWGTFIISAIQVHLQHQVASLLKNDIWAVSKTCYLMNDMRKDRRDEKMRKISAATVDLKENRI